MSIVAQLQHENTEYKHKISNLNMVNQQLNTTTEELRIKIQELNNKTTELDFLFKQKEKEVSIFNRNYNTWV